MTALATTENHVARDHTQRHEGCMRLDELALECGAVLEQVEVRFTTLGVRRATANNVVWVCHTLTSNADPTSWWPGLVGPGKLIDPARHFVVCANVLGSCYGTTGPASIRPRHATRYGMDFPLVTIRDTARVHERLCRYLGIERIRLGIGGSLGGQHLLEWAAAHGDRFDNLCLVATNAKHSAWGIAFNETQRMALEADATLFAKQDGAGHAGLEAARAIAMLSYRSFAHYCAAQTDTESRIDDFKASSYQRHQGRKLADRFDAQAYWYLTKAMDSHDLARGRHSLESTLQSIPSPTLVVGFSSDLLFPAEEQRFVARHLPRARVEIVETPYGHDATLLESSAIAHCARQELNLA